MKKNVATMKATVFQRSIENIGRTECELLRSRSLVSEDVIRELRNRSDDYVHRVIVYNQLVSDQLNESNCNELVFAEVSEASTNASTTVSLDKCNISGSMLKDLKEKIIKIQQTKFVFVPTIVDEMPVLNHYLAYRTFDDIEKNFTDQINRMNNEATGKSDVDEPTKEFIKTKKREFIMNTDADWSPAIQTYLEELNDYGTIFAASQLRDVRKRNTNITQSQRILNCIYSQVKLYLQDPKFINAETFCAATGDSQEKAINFSRVYLNKLASFAKVVSPNATKEAKLQDLTETRIKDFLNQVAPEFSKENCHTFFDKVLSEKEKLTEAIVEMMVYVPLYPDNATSAEIDAERSDRLNKYVAIIQEHLQTASNEYPRSNMWLTTCIQSQCLTKEFEQFVSGNPLAANATGHEINKRFEKLLNLGHALVSLFMKLHIRASADIPHDILDRTGRKG